jgi:hypothetical protein
MIAALPAFGKGFSQEIAGFSSALALWGLCAASHLHYYSYVTANTETSQKAARLGAAARSRSLVFFGRPTTHTDSI